NGGPDAPDLFDAAAGGTYFPASAREYFLTQRPCAAQSAFFRPRRPRGPRKAMGRFVVSPTCASCVAHAPSLPAVKRAAHPSTRTGSGSVTPEGSFTGRLLHSSTAAPRHARKPVCQTPNHQSCAPKCCGPCDLSDGAGPEETTRPRPLDSRPRRLGGRCFANADVRWQNGVDREGCGCGAWGSAGARGSDKEWGARCGGELCGTSRGFSRLLAAAWIRWRPVPDRAWTSFSGWRVACEVVFSNARAVIFATGRGLERRDACGARRWCRVRYVRRPPSLYTVDIGFVCFVPFGVLGGTWARFWRDTL
ncbi:uncharacterized protein Tco025E_09117, partial [Trypanosoma conorhini]